MKNILLPLLLIIVAIPFFTNAHIGDSTTSQEPGFMMMQQLEDVALGSDLHEEMEDLMLKMMSGNLSEEETPRLLEFMDEYPGVQSMMMGRMMGTGMGPMSSGFGGFGNNSMMGGFGYGGSTGGGLLMIVLWGLAIVGAIVIGKYFLGSLSKQNSKGGRE